MGQVNKSNGYDKSKAKNSSFLAFGYASFTTVVVGIFFATLLLFWKSALAMIILLLPFSSFDVRGQGSEVGRHWNDGSLGARARFEEKANPLPVLWIEDLRDGDEGTYRCRVDFKHAPTQNFKIHLEVIGKYIHFKK